MSDIHNNNESFCKMLELINFAKNDQLFILGDIFDRSDYNPNPVDLYFNICSLGRRCIVLKGNHDSWLASYILKYYRMLGMETKKD